MQELDERFITNEFLIEYFPSPNRFYESNYITLEVSKERYIEFKKKINQKRARIGKEPLNDSDIKQVIEAEQGTVHLKNIIK